VTPGVPLAEVTRRDRASGREVVESVHTGHLVVTDAEGGVLGQLGDPDAVTFARSTVKPLQATACLELLGPDGPEPSASELAVAWASHRGEPAQIEAVARLLERSGTRPDELTCPAAVPDADPAAAPSRIQHNCSGKHALFALAGAALGVPREQLLDPSAPLQSAILRELQDLLGPFDAVGVDGCGAPAVALRLSRLATAYAALAGDPRFRAVRDAGFEHPDLVGGKGRLETALLSAGVLAKVGAEGVYAAGWLAEDGSPRGLAIKGADGAPRGSAAAMTTVLVDLGVVAAGCWSPPPPLGGGEPVGVVRASDTVRGLVSDPRLR
jgi:L-asparaginase II